MRFVLRLVAVLALALSVGTTGLAAGGTNTKPGGAAQQHGAKKAPRRSGRQSVYKGGGPSASPVRRHLNQRQVREFYRRMLLEF